jgi:Zn-dependent protease
VFFEPTETPYDLRWRMLGTHIRVSPWFWLMSLVLGGQLLQLGLHYLLIWVACVFVCILVHEFGHVLMGRIFGAQGNIVLYSFGGLAIGSSNLRNHWQRILVYLAGPGIGFLFAVPLFILYLAATSSEGSGELSLLAVTLYFLLKINIGWGILNLLPVYPLDGGQVSHDGFDWFIPGGQGIRIAFGVSLGVAAVIALVAILIKDFYLAIMFGLLAFNSFQLMQHTPVRGGYSSNDRAPWEQDPDAWKQGGQRW